MFRMILSTCETLLCKLTHLKYIYIKYIYKVYILNIHILCQIIKNELIEIWFYKYFVLKIYDLCKGNKIKGAVWIWKAELRITKEREGFPDGSDSKKSACSVGDLGSIPGLGRFPEEGVATHFSILAIVDFGAW